MWPNPKFLTYLVTFTEKILNGKFHFLCSTVRAFSFEVYGNSSDEDDHCQQNKFESKNKDFAEEEQGLTRGTGRRIWKTTNGT